MGNIKEVPLNIMGMTLKKKKKKKKGNVNYGEKCILGKTMKDVICTNKLLNVIVEIH